MEKVSVFIKTRVLFWPEISALGVFFCEKSAANVVTVRASNNTKED